jgi:hypothetical protein
VSNVARMAIPEKYPGPRARFWMVDAVCKSSPWERRTCELYTVQFLP